MQKTANKILLILIPCFCFAIFGCSKKEAKECDIKPVIATTTTSDPCIAQGTITVTAPLGNNIQYRITNLSFQSSPVFNNLLPGSYTITAKDENGCSHSSDAEVLPVTMTPGSLFSMVKSVLGSNCVSCHGGSNPQSGIDFSRNCDIINNWSRIKARAVDGNPSPMPQGGLLPLSERNKIVNWINAGHRFTD